MRTALPSHTAHPRTNLRDGTTLRVAATLVWGAAPYPGYGEVEHRAIDVSLVFRMRESTAHFLEVLCEVVTTRPHHTAPPRTNMIGGTALSVSTTLGWSKFHITGVTRLRIELASSPSLSIRSLCTPTDVGVAVGVAVGV